MTCTLETTIIIHPSSYLDYERQSWAKSRIILSPNTVIVLAIMIWSATGYLNITELDTHSNFQTRYTAGTPLLVD